MAIGGAMLVWVVWPIITFAAISDALFSKTVAPVPDMVQPVARGGNTLSPVVFAANGVAENGFGSVDFTNANTWFPSSPQKKIVTPVNTYTLSIPKLKIADAMVTISGEDLNASLVHYGGTGLPGEYGNAVIFGHSTLPQFYSPTNYRTIFSTVPTLKIGDEILITYDGVSYRYEVFEMTVNDPSDLSALEQKFDDSYITLVTCVPPGTYWKRLHVKAKLVRLPI
jgi:sortase A